MRSPLIALAILASTHVARADVDDPLYACQVPAAGSKLSASFKPDTSLQDLAVWVTGFTCKSIVFSSDVPKRATRVTVISPKAMTTKQALALFVDAVEATGLTVTVKPDTIIIKLGPNMPKSCPDIAATGGELDGNPFSKPVAPVAPTTPSPEELDLDAAVAKGITKIDETHYVMKRELLDKIQANPMGIAKGARVVPAMKAGKPDGFKLYAIRPVGLWGKLGFLNGDTIQTINGDAVDSADKALDIYAKLREAKDVVVGITRRGAAVTISIKITK